MATSRNSAELLYPVLDDGIGRSKVAAYGESGSDNLIVLKHGSGYDPSIYDEMLDGMARNGDARVIAPWGAETGETAPPLHGEHISHRTELLLRSLGVNRKNIGSVSLVGHSRGGWEIMETALHLPAGHPKFRKVVTLSTPIDEVSESSIMLARLTTGAFVSCGTDMMHGDTRSTQRFFNTTVSNALKMFTNPFHALDELMVSEEQIRDYSLEKRRQLFVSGQAFGAFGRDDIAVTRPRGWPKTITVPGGHDFMLNNQAKSAEQILGWLGLSAPIPVPAPVRALVA